MRKKHAGKIVGSFLAAGQEIKRVRTDNLHLYQLEGIGKKINLSSEQVQLVQLTYLKEVNVKFQDFKGTFSDIFLF